jgi:hypothetical protein
MPRPGVLQLIFMCETIEAPGRRCDGTHDQDSTPGTIACSLNYPVDDAFPILPQRRIGLSADSADRLMADIQPSAEAVAAGASATVVDKQACGNTPLGRQTATYNLRPPHDVQMGSIRSCPHNIRPRITVNDAIPRFWD